MADLIGPTAMHTAHLYMQTIANPTILQHEVQIGVTYMTAFISTIVALFAGFGVGWYAKGRGLTGVKTDIGNAVNTVKTDASAL